MSARKQKTNPRRIPATKDDVEAARADGTEKGLLLCVWTLSDLGLMTAEQIEKFAHSVNSTAQSINLGYLTWDDLERTLQEEYDIKFDLR